MNPQKLADGAAVGTWAAWVFSHLAQVNSILQTILLLVGIVSGIFAAIYHARKW